MLRRPTPEWYVMVDSWLNIPYPEWYVRYVKVHFQAALSPDAFMGAFSQEARGTVDPELAQVCAHPLLASDPPAMSCKCWFQSVPQCEGGRAVTIVDRLCAPKVLDCQFILPF